MSWSRDQRSILLAKEKVCALQHKGSARTSQNSVTRTLLQRAALVLEEEMAIEKGVSIFPANGAFICPCLPVGWPLPSRGDCSPLGGILVRLVGCISLEIS